MAKTTQVKLYSSQLDETRPFDLKHAQRLLNFQKSNNGVSDWEIAPKQPFEYTDGLINPTGKGSHQDASEQRGHTAGQGS